jgi:hypothetical protein
MRITRSALIALAVAGLTSSYAAAQTANSTQNGSGTQIANSTKSANHYATCSCHFGYGNVCIVVEACDSGGGRCSGSCTPEPNEGLTNR